MGIHPELSKRIAILKCLRISPLSRDEFQFFTDVDTPFRTKKGIAPNGKTQNSVEGQVESRDPGRFQPRNGS